MELSDVMYQLDTAVEALTEYYTQCPERDEYTEQWARETVRAITAQMDKMRP